MNLEKLHFQAPKMPNRGFVDDRNLRAEGLMTYEESHFQAAKKLKRLSQEAMYP
jgi:hypothetical protein